MLSDQIDDLPSLDSNFRAKNFQLGLSTPCSLGLSATSQHYFSLRTNQPTILFSQNKPANNTLLSEQTSTSHQPPANSTLLSDPSSN
jgi:hypothetical protein